jgi:hypothetical protein
VDHRRTLATLALLVACGDASAAKVPVVDGFEEPAGTLRLAGAIGFADGAVVEGLEIAPASPRPGEPIVVRFDSSEAGGYRVGVRPPRDVSRQVAKGGVGAPPFEVPIDPRASFVEVAVDGRGEAALTLPQPWHPERAVLTIERLASGVAVPADAGPRTAAGIGLVAALAVASAPTSARAVRSGTAIVVDGVLDETAWADATALPQVASLDGEPDEGAPTLVRFAWSDAALHVAAELPDVDVWSTFVRRDDPLWKEEVFELFVFVEPNGRDYLELQVSPRGVQFDARFVRHRDGDTGWNGAWQAAVDLRGTVDDRSDRDQGWTAELAVPWSDICGNTALQCPVAAGTVLRVNAFRLERPARGAPVGLALSPTRVPDFHASANAARLELLP